jgi:DNA-binding NarL/FixJ family response regulator
MKSLSVREIQIIKYTAKGFTAKEIAKALGLEYRTIEIYVSNIRKKLAAKNIAHAIYIAT